MDKEREEFKRKQEKKLMDVQTNSASTPLIKTAVRVRSLENRNESVIPEEIEEEPEVQEVPKRV